MFTRNLYAYFYRNMRYSHILHIRRSLGKFSREIIPATSRDKTQLEEYTMA